MSHQRTHDSNVEIVETLRETADSPEVEVKPHLEDGQTITGSCNEIRHHYPLKAESEKEHPTSGAASFHLEVDADEIPTEHELNKAVHYIIIDTDENSTTGEWRDPEADWYVDEEHLANCDADTYGSSYVTEVEVLDSA